jgi:hypothetical protein
VYLNRRVKKKQKKTHDSLPNISFKKKRKRTTNNPSGNKNNPKGKIQQSQRNLEGGHQWPFQTEVTIRSTYRSILLPRRCWNRLTFLSKKDSPIDESGETKSAVMPCLQNNLNSFHVPLKDHPTEKSIMGQFNQRYHPPSVFTFPSLHFISFEMFQ